MRLRLLLFGRFISALVLGLHLAWASFLRRLMLVYSVGLPKSVDLLRGLLQPELVFQFWCCRPCQLP